MRGRSCGRDGAQCRAQWTHAHSPLVRHGGPSSWGGAETQALQQLAQRSGARDWERIAAAHGSRHRDGEGRARTPAQCLQRYQTHLSASLGSRDAWTAVEDKQLSRAVQVRAALCLHYSTRAALCLHYSTRTAEPRGAGESGSLPAL
jgi:hypothetical protein